mgnify:CR=1 FL=1|jgi:hypothetical protein|tara:strand:- start:792 stop:1175 length:384 start_codon:yes stop_codon:yes gene_type:complete
MKHYGTVKEGKLILKNKRIFNDSLLSLEGKEVEIKIREKSFNRSREQNSLYWKWIDLLSKECGYTKEEMHELIKYKFLKRNIVDDDGQEQEVIKSTTTLTTKEFNLFMNDLLYWSNNTLNINLPSYE